jgi:hypothetical protein
MMPMPVHFPRGFAARLPLLLAMLLLGMVGERALAQPGTLRGTVTDSAGRPLRDVEVISINTKRSTRTGNDGRYVLTKLSFGQQLVMARSPGYRAAEKVITMLDDATPPVDFVLGRVVQAIDTVRIVAADSCAPYDFAGYECRKRMGVGQFRGEEEIRALKPYYWADMFEGLPGLRRSPTRNPRIGLDWTIDATTGWRCVQEGWNGRHRTAADENVQPSDIVAIEHYDVYEKVPEAYKRLAWPNGQDKPCALVMYWTRGFIEHEKDRRP